MDWNKAKVMKSELCNKGNIFESSFVIYIIVSELILYHYIFVSLCLH